MSILARRVCWLSYIVRGNGVVQPTTYCQLSSCEKEHGKEI